MTLTSFRQILDGRKEAVTHKNPIRTTEEFIKFAQPWPINEDDKPAAKKQKRDDDDDSGSKEAQKLVASTFSQDEYIPVELVGRKEINDDTRIYTFKHNQKSIESFNIGLGQHILCGFMMNNGIVERPYAITRPTGADKDDGTFDILVKTAFPNDDKDPGGIVSNILDCLSKERKDEMLVRGPEGPIVYHGKGKFSITPDNGSIKDSKKKNKKTTEVECKKVNFITGGTGMTPIYATIKTILESDDDLEICFINANKEESDILLEEELSKLVEKYDNFTLHHVLEHPPKDWDGEVGRIEKKVLEKLHISPHEGTISLVCGPPPMLKAAKESLLDLGFEEDKSFFHY